MEHLAGIVLAAGISSRIKRVKALLYVNGQSMICQVVHMMQQIRYIIFLNKNLVIVKS